jgi:hypothetical protein
MAYSIYKFRSFTAAQRKPNIHYFGLLSSGRSLDFIDSAPDDPNSYDGVVELSGTKNGSNLIFTYPSQSGTVFLTKNSLRLISPNDYSAVTVGSTVTVTMAVAPVASDSLFAIRVVEGGTVPRDYRWEFTGQTKDGSNTVFTLPSGALYVEIYVNGLQQRRGEEWTLGADGVTVTMGIAPEANDQFWAVINYR